MIQHSLKDLQQKQLSILWDMFMTSFWPIDESWLNEFWNTQEDSVIYCVYNSWAVDAKMFEWTCPKWSHSIFSDNLLEWLVTVDETLFPLMIWRLNNTQFSGSTLVFQKLTRKIMTIFWEIRKLFLWFIFRKVKQLKQNTTLIGC